MDNLAQQFQQSKTEASALCGVPGGRSARWGQEKKAPSAGLSQSDRRLLLAASLGLLLRRIRVGLEIRSADVSRLVAFADDAVPEGVGQPEAGDRAT